MELSQKSQALQFLQVQLLQLSRLGALPLQRLLPGRLAPKKKNEKNREKFGKNRETWDEQWDQDAETWRIG